MKKAFLFFIFAAYITQGNAQIKVASNGKTVFGLSSVTPLSTISVNCEGRTDSKVTILGTELGIYTRRLGTAHWGNAMQAISENVNTTFSVGIRAEALNSTPLGSGRSYGVFGIAGNSTSGWNYGLFGRLQGNQNGAGVYGTITSDENGINTQGRYAGFFNGPTKVAGDLTVTGSISGVILSSSAINNNTSYSPKKSYATNYETEENFSSKLSSLNLLSYHFPQEDAAMAKQLKTSGDTITSSHELTRNELLCLEKKHYGLSAEQLQNEFPDLVYEQEDGSMAINYIEMIPILIQTINELNNRIALLEGTSYTAGNNATYIDNADNRANKLYQNTPNPFRNSTTINLNISPDVKKSTLYFYDINGIKTKTYNITERGKVSIQLPASDFESGLYVYALVTDGKVISTKRMIVDK